LSENMEEIAALAQQTSIPIALGERLYSRWDFKKVLESRAVDIIQPDVSHAGGITECRKIAAMAESYDIALALHCPLGPIALAACLQVGAVGYHASLQGQGLGIRYHAAGVVRGYIGSRGVFAHQAGMVKIPDGAGWGIEVHEEYV